MIIVGIDPGLEGGFIRMDGLFPVHWHPMPTKGAKTAREIDYPAVKMTLLRLDATHVVLERSVSFGMGSKGAFNYGRGFAALEIAIHELQLPVTYVEARKWQKDLFDGIDTRLKPKEQSLIAAERLLPVHFAALPRNKKGKPHEGAVDALLIAEWGRRKLK